MLLLLLLQLQLLSQGHALLLRLSSKPLLLLKLALRLGQPCLQVSALSLVVGSYSVIVDRQCKAAPAVLKARQLLQLSRRVLRMHHSS